MDTAALTELLEAVRRGELAVDEALARLRRLPFERTEFATIDHHRAVRCGTAEVVYCPGKTPEQVAQIFARLAEAGANVLATRADRAAYDAVAAAAPAAEYHETARAITLRQRQAEPVGHVAIVAAGTSDLPIAEEARVTAELADARVTTHYDVGVAGLHRLLAHTGELQAARAIVVVAGMEGALASVVGGLVAVPVVAVPTSVGYGASFQGLAALLTMLNSCASNVSVVNIDNGFGGGHIAALINRRSP
jgi:NCAIR mutase (PurE)-related protein